MDTAQLQTTEVDAVILRLKKIEGQVRGLQRSLEEGADCEHVLRQFAAASNALRSAGMVLAVSALEHCLLEGEAPQGERFRKAILGLA